jgi:hypothetical protein
MSKMLSVDLLLVNSSRQWSGKPRLNIGQALDQKE